VSPRFVSLGEIVTTHGLGGWLKLNCYNPDSTVLSPARQVFLERQGIRSPQEIESSQRYRGGQFLVKLRGVDSLTEAEKWVGFVLSVPEEALPPLPSGEYYHYQAIGLEVLDTRGERIGIVIRTLSTPAGELYVVQGSSREYLIPAVREIVEKVDLSVGKIIINPPEGLLDL
jgi:16S rRNA processing protein RimM